MVEYNQRSANHRTTYEAVAADREFGRLLACYRPGDELWVWENTYCYGQTAPPCEDGYILLGYAIVRNGKAWKGMTLEWARIEFGG